MTTTIEEGNSVTVKLGFVVKVVLYWNSGGGTEIIAEFDTV